MSPILAFATPSGPSLAAAHWPILTPASKLSVAKVILAASGGSVEVSMAMTTTPASRALMIAGVTSLLEGAIRIVVAPRAMAFSIQAVCPSGSGSTAPEQV